MRRQRNQETGIALLLELLVIASIMLALIGVAAQSANKYQQVASENSAAMQLAQVSASEFSMMQLYGIAVPPSQLTGTLATPISCANPMLASGVQTQAPKGYAPMTFTPGAPINSNVTSCSSVPNAVSTYAINLDPDPANSLQAQRHYYTDQTQVVRFATGRPATSADSVYPIAMPTQGTISNILALTSPPATGGSGGGTGTGTGGNPTGNGQPGGQYAVTVLLEGGGSVITTLTGTFTIDPTSGTMSASLAGSGSCTAYGSMLSGNGQDSFIINGCGWGGSQFVGQGSYQNSDYNLTFNGAQQGCGNCGQSVVITGLQQ